MQQWEYLSIVLSWTRRQDQPGPQQVEGWDAGDGELREIDEILADHGSQGWELISLVPERTTQLPAGLDFPTMQVDEYRATFKRTMQ